MGSPCRVLVLAAPGFLGGYVAEGLRRAGIEVADSIDAAAGEAHAWQGAVLDVGIDARELLATAARLSTAGVPIVLIGRVCGPWPVLLEGWPFLAQPFASFQVIDGLRAAGLAIPATGGSATSACPA